MKPVVPVCKDCGLPFIRVEDKANEFEICRECENKSLQAKLRDAEERARELESESDRRMEVICQLLTGLADMVGIDIMKEIQTRILDKGEE